MYGVSPGEREGGLHTSPSSRPPPHQKQPASCEMAALMPTCWEEVDEARSFRNCLRGSEYINCGLLG